jgi:hypothetical protein
MPQVDYEKLAQKYGGSVAQPSAVDYDAIASKYGGVVDGESQKKFAADREAQNQANLKRYTEDPGFFAGVGSELQNLNPITMVKGAYDMITSPLETGKRIIDLQGQQFTKAGEQFKRGNYIQAGGNALAGMVPLVGPVAQEAGDAIAEGKTGYGIGKGAALIAGTLAPGAIVKAAKSAPVTAAREATATALRGSAVKNLESVLHPTTRKTKFLSDTKVAPGLVEKGETAFTLKGLQNKAVKRVEALGKSIGDYWDAMPDNATAPANDIIRKLRSETLGEHAIRSAKGKMIPKDAEAAKAIRATEDLLKTLDQLSTVDANGVKQIPVKKLREMRQYWDARAARAGRYSGTDLAAASEAEIKGRVADAIREEFAKADPSLNAINKEFSFWKDVEKVADETLLRKVGQRPSLLKSMSEDAATIAGGASGGWFGAIGGKYAMRLWNEVSNSTAWNTISAAGKSKLADAIASGKKGKVIIELEKLRKEAVSSTALVPRNATPNE